MLTARSDGTFFYNNANYSLLSLIVKEVSGTSHESYCRRILSARGAAGAHIAAGLHAMGPFGGWEISAPEYLNFGRAFDRSQQMMSSSAYKFLESDSYTLGVGVFKTAHGRQYQHFGDWNANWTVPKQMSAYFCLWDNGISVCATYDRHVNDEQKNRLEAALREASYGR